MKGLFWELLFWVWEGVENVLIGLYTRIFAKLGATARARKRTIITCEENVFNGGDKTFPKFNSNPVYCVDAVDVGMLSATQILSTAIYIRQQFSEKGITETTRTLTGCSGASDIAFST